ncbi:hypothetical protein [Beijerinckia mobilis]|uniref:hypothetical protein n=1 Tax=Beijerinckia mobilis TaxID=231434 RepID=UPI00054D1939|nr:hypothetical protein [Beijerinckia mobilis]
MSTNSFTPSAPTGKHFQPFRMDEVRSALAQERMSPDEFIQAWLPYALSLKGGSADDALRRCLGNGMHAFDGNSLQKMERHSRGFDFSK